MIASVKYPFGNLGPDLNGQIVNVTDIPCTEHAKMGMRTNGGKVPTLREIEGRTFCTLHGWSE
jgi:hypothetical protein